MSNDARPFDYGKVKAAALEELARAGDQAATRELHRRGLSAAAAADVAQLETEQLRRLVLAWREGGTPEERGRSRDRAARAHAELEIRHQVDVALWDGKGPAPVPPPVAPWLAPGPRRCVPWRRPEGSTLYPTTVDLSREALNAIAPDVYARRRA